LIHSAMDQGNSTAQTVSSLAARLGAVEQSARAGDGKHSKDQWSDDVDFGARLWRVEHEMTDLEERYKRIELEARGEAGWGAKLQEHEVRLSGIRAKLDGQDEHINSFTERARQDWEARFKQLRQSVQDSVGEQRVKGERLESVLRWAEETDQVVQELRQYILGDIESAAPAGPLSLSQSAVASSTGQVAERDEDGGVQRVPLLHADSRVNQFDGEARFGTDPQQLPIVPELEADQLAQARAQQARFGTDPHQLPIAPELEADQLAEARAQQGLDAALDWPPGSAGSAGLRPRQ